MHELFFENLSDLNEILEIWMAWKDYNRFECVSWRVWRHEYDQHYSNVRLAFKFFTVATEYLFVWQCRQCSEFGFCWIIFQIDKGKSVTCLNWFMYAYTAHKSGNERTWKWIMGECKGFWIKRCNMSDVFIWLNDPFYMVAPFFYVVYTHIT